MPERSPGVGLVDVPVAHRVDFEQCADARQQGRQGVALRWLLARRVQHGASPLHGERDQLRRMAIRLRRQWLQHPERAGIAGQRREGGVWLGAIAGTGVARPDEEIGDIFEAAAGLVAKEQPLDLAQHLAARGAEAAHVAADESERQVDAGKIRHRSEHAAAAQLGGPLRDVVDLDQPDIEVDERVLHREVGVDGREGQPGELLLRADADPPALAAQHGFDHLAGFSRHMAVGEGVDRVAVAHQAGDRRGVVLALRAGDDGIAGSDIVQRVEDVGGRDRRPGLARRLDDTDRHVRAVRHQEGLGHHGIGARRKGLGQFPLRDENQDAGPGVGTDLRIVEAAHARSLFLLLVVRPAVGLADSIAADGRGHHVGASHEFEVEQIARRDQVLQRQMRELVLIVLEKRQVDLGLPKHCILQAGDQWPGACRALRGTSGEG